MGEGVDRRQFLRMAGLGVAGGTIAAVAGSAPFALAAPPNKSGVVSGNQTFATGFTVPAGTTLKFDPNVSTTVRVSANVVVNGTLQMKPSSASITHKLIFENVDESDFVGGGMDVLDTDVGLWVMGAGKLDIAGTPRVAWNRTGDDSSWKSSDTLVVTPTKFGDYGGNGFASFTKGGSVPGVANPYGGAGSLASAPTPFVDIADSVHKDAIEALYTAGITKGTTTTTFSPKSPVTRGQMAAFIVRADNLPAAPSAGFTDTKGHTFEDEIDRLYDAGITKGTSSTTFSPDAEVTRGQMAAFLVRALKLPTAPSAGFVDTRGHTFEDEINRLFAAGITQGTSTDHFSPDDPVTRGQMASFLVRGYGFSVPEAADTSFRSEVLNLTRNVVIQGTTSGYSHVFIRSSKAQSIKHAVLRYMGPRAFSPDDPTTGRYGIHFHMAGNGSRGSIVEGVVVRDADNHAFVPHLSNGITFVDCISYKTDEAAYWWDPRAGNDTHDIRYERCVAGLVDSSANAHRLAGFSLEAGEGNAVVDCVATGVQGLTDSSGFTWPEFASGSVWEFHDNVAHNNKRNGIFTWQNDDSNHDNFDFTCYHNGGNGIKHGAYVNLYTYRNAILYGNREGAVLLPTVSFPGKSDRLTFEGVVMDGAGRSTHLVDNAAHINVDGATVPPPIQFLACGLTGSTGAKVYLDKAAGQGSGTKMLKDRWDFVECGLDADDVDVTSTADPEALVRVQNGSSAFQVSTSGVKTISRFA